jgi:hypothetical protein
MRTPGYYFRFLSQLWFICDRFCVVKEGPPPEDLRQRNQHILQLSGVDMASPWAAELLDVFTGRWLEEATRLFGCFYLLVSSWFYSDSWSCCLVAVVRASELTVYMHNTAQHSTTRPIRVQLQSVQVLMVDGS